MAIFDLKAGRHDGLTGNPRQAAEHANPHPASSIAGTLI
jgi:hypothetical protein